MQTSCICCRWHTKKGTLQTQVHRDLFAILLHEQRQTAIAGSSCAPLMGLVDRLLASASSMSCSLVRHTSPRWRACSSRAGVKHLPLSCLKAAADSSCWSNKTGEQA